MMLNVISKAKEIVATSDAKFLLIPNISVEEDIITSARQLIDEMIHPPLAQHKTVLEAYDLPPGSLVNVRVQAVEADDVKTVTTSYGAETEVRNGVFGDENGAMPFAFWRRLASAQIAVGDCIRVNSAVLSKTTDGNPKLSGNQRTTIEFFSRNAIQAVRGSSRYEEEGEIVAISSVNLYSSCKRQACFQKKLIENKCPKCLIDYSGESSAVSVMCSVAIQQHDEIETKILFTPQVTELLNNEQFSLHSKEEVEKTFCRYYLPK